MLALQRSASLARPALGTKNSKSGVSAVCATLHPLTFASGGHDHVIHLWDTLDDLSSATPRALPIKHNSVVQSLLAIRDTSHKLVTASADCSVHIFDLSSERVAHTMRLSNSVYHVHSTSTPFCTLMEVSICIWVHLDSPLTERAVPQVAHREFQFEIRDHRIVPGKPVQRFGYITERLHGRFMKGASKCLMNANDFIF